MDKVKKNDFESLSNDTKYRLLVLLMNFILPNLSENLKNEKKSNCFILDFNSTKKENIIKNSLNRIKSNSYFGKTDMETLKILPKLIDNEDKFNRQKFKYNIIGNLEK